jgi:hypothetical protein
MPDRLGKIHPDLAGELTFLHDRGANAVIDLAESQRVICLPRTTCDRGAFSNLKGNAARCERLVQPLFTSDLEHEKPGAKSAAWNLAWPQSGKA